MKVGILGTALTTRHLAPIHEPGWEWWGMNNIYRVLPGVPWTRWFEIHDLQLKDGRWIRRGKEKLKDQQVDDYLVELASFQIPVYMKRKWNEIPSSREFPLREALTRFRRFFKGSVSYMIALAIMEGFKKIGFWGIDLSSSEEYGEQHPSAAYFAGLAEGMGIELIIPDEADFLKTRYLYGFEEEREDLYTGKIKALAEATRQQLFQAGNDKTQAIRVESELVGALRILERITKIWQ